METTIPPSRAKAFFDEVKLPENGAIFLNRLIGSETPTFESEFLDFKGGRHLDVQGNSLLELWAKCLSCFANSDGGVVIFGIDAPKGTAKSLSLVQDVAGLRERLKSLIPKVTEPPVLRVEIETYTDPPDANTGFVVCYIPASPWRPHQVKLDGQPNQFYVRAADNCVPCNHSTLRALFAPQMVSKLDVYYNVIVRRDPVNRWTNIFLRCWLINDGPATASELFVLCEAPPTAQAPQYDHRLWAETASGRPGHAFVAARSIHPGEKLQMFDIQLGAYATNGNGVGDIYERESFTLKLSLSAKNQAPIKSEITIQERDLNDAPDKKAILVL